MVTNNMALIQKCFQLILGFFFLIGTAHAESPIKIENTWSPEAPPVVKVMAGYMKISNSGNKDIKIKSAKSSLFKKVEIHLSQNKNGMMRMLKQENLAVKAHSQIELKPGGLHMMLIGKLKPIKSGSFIPVTLLFSNSESINIKLKVKTDNEPEMKCGSMMKQH